MNRRPDDKKTIIAALRESGFQLIKEGKISPDKLELIAQPLVSFKDDLREQTDHYLTIKKSQKPK
jgi:hypothetical protein